MAEKKVKTRVALTSEDNWVSLRAGLKASMKGNFSPAH